MNLKNITEMSETGRVLSGNGLYIGQGVMICNDSLVIPLDNIAMLDLNRVADLSYGNLWQTLGIGTLVAIFGIVMKQPLIIIIGFAVFIYAVLKIWKIYRYNQIKIYRISIQLSSGKMFYYDHVSLKFICEVMNVFIKCINDRHSGYKIINNVEKIEYSDDNSITVGPTVKVSGQSGDISVGDTQHVSGGSQIHNEQPQSDKKEDWDRVIQFLQTRQALFDVNSNNAQVVEKYLAAARRQDSMELKKIYREAGRTVNNAVFTEKIDEESRRNVIASLKKIIGV